MGCVQRKNSRAGGGLGEKPAHLVYREALAARFVLGRPPHDGLRCLGRTVHRTRVYICRLFLRGRWSWRLEARLVGLIWIIEDALWFALNPAFG